MQTLSSSRSLATATCLALLLPWLACHAGGAAESRDDLRSLLRNKSQSSEDFLLPDDAFRFTAELQANDQVKLEWVIAPGYYLYKNRVRLDSSAKDVQLGAPQLPRGKLKHDEYFGDTEVYYEVIEARVPVKQRGSARDLNFTVTYQGCAEAGLCYTPIVKQVALPLTTEVTTPGDRSKQIGDTQRPSSSPVSGGGKSPPQ